MEANGKGRWFRLGQLALLLIGTLLISWSWQYKSFAALLSGGVVLATLITLLIPRCQSIAIPLISVGCMLVLGELILPFVLVNPQNSTHYDRTSSYVSGRYFERVPGFGYRPIPGVYASRKVSSEGDPIYDVVYTIGQDGYRQGSYRTNPDLRIYGGSFVFGEGLNDDETLSFYLHRNHGIKAKNVGIQGFGMHQALYNVEQDIVSQRNGLNVLLTAPWHALRSSCKESFSAETPRYEMTEKGLHLGGVCGGGYYLSRVLRRSYIFSLVTSAAGNSNVITDSDINLYIEIIKEIARLSKKNNSQLLVAYIDASEYQLSGTKWTNEDVISKLSSVAAVVDVTLASTREELDSKYYIHELDQHPSAVANERRAAIIASFAKNFR